MEPRFRTNRLTALQRNSSTPSVSSQNPTNIFRSRTSRITNTNQPEIGEFRKALPQFIAVGVKNILLFVYGMTLGFPTIVIPAIQGGDGREPSDIVLNRDEISWFSSINLICVPLGCIFSGAFTLPLGKRKAMQIINIPILISWLLFHFSTSIGYLYAGLCLSGLSGGLMEAPVLTYVAEITEPKYRGMLAASGTACVIVGIFVQFILGSILDWRTIAAVSTVFPVISVIALFFIPESPHWLIKKNRFPEAIKALTWLRGWVPEYQIESEFNELYDTIIVKPLQEDRADNKSKVSFIIRYLRLFKKKSFLSPFGLILLTFFIGHFSGKTALQTYAVQIFHTLKTPVDKYHATILLGLAELIGTILCIVLIHFTGKRPLVFASTIGCGLCFFGTATYAHFLKLVPGYAVSNVVVNASSIVPQENIITLKNVTEIFDKEEEALERIALFVKPLNKIILTTKDFDVVEATTTELVELNENNRSARSTEYEQSFNMSDDYFDFPSDNTIDSFQFDINDTDYVTSVPLLNDTDYNIETPSPIIPVTIELNEVLDPLQNHSEIHQKILVPVPKQQKNKYLWVPLVLLLGSAFFAHLGIRLIPWMLIGEVFPPQIRSNASGISGGMGYLFGFLANKLFLQMLSLMTMPGTFWFYSGVAIVGTVVLYFILPETEGRSLKDIQNEFSTAKTKQTKVEEEENTCHIQTSLERTDHIRSKDSSIDSINLRNGPVARQIQSKIKNNFDNKSFVLDERSQNDTKF